MRKHQQKQIIDIIATLKEANEEIKRLFLDENLSSLLELLVEIQNTIIKVGEFIEGLEGEGTRTITLLEEYYEDLYHIAKDIEAVDSSFIKRLQKQLARIENNIRSEFIPDKIEIVFLPYNASMWDSLESIWLAAKADPQCDVYCVPIPYYELNHDGKPGRMHYEGADYYDDNIEITNWQEYDIKGRHPDVIFTHYAYDDMARNATIHPDFYSKILREHCGRLVYVPYYVTPRNTVDEYYAYLPGVLHANYVMLQSEEIRQSHIKHYKKFDKKYNLNSFYGKAENKFIAIGSPKIDKVISSKNIRYGLPPAWQRLIYKEDGERKKVVLYNTHMFTWINGGENYFKKVRSVFEAFKKRNDVVLWWRPHPNTELNFRTLRPELLSEYVKIVEEYKREGWGVYDDTFNLHRAIAMSDAYYGDWSSLVALYQVTGKPIMIQNLLLHLYDNSKFTLALADFADDGENVWFCSASFNAIFYANKNTWNPVFVGCFPHEASRSEMLYSSIIMHYNKLYFAPYNANEIAIYDFQSHEFTKIPLQNKFGIKTAKFNGLYVNGDHLFFIGCSYPVILKLNIVTLEIDYYTLKGFRPNLSEEVVFRFVTRSYQEDNKIILPMVTEDKVYEFDMDTCTSRILFEGNRSCGYYDITSDGLDYWLIPADGKALVKYNIANRKVSCFNIPNIYQSNGYIDYHMLLSVDSEVFIFPNQANYVLVFDKTIENFSVNDLLTKKCTDVDNSGFYPTLNYMMVKLNKDTIFAYIGKSNKFIRYEISKNVLDSRHIVLDEENEAFIKQLLNNAIDEKYDFADDINDCLFIENSVMQLDNFIDYIVNYQEAYKKLLEKQTELAENITTNGNGKAGKCIFDYVKKEAGL